MRGGIFYSGKTFQTMLDVFRNCGYIVQKKISRLKTFLIYQKFGRMTFKN